MKKQLFVVFGKPNTGKSYTIRKLYEKLINIPGCKQGIIYTSVDTEIKTIIEINGIKIGIESRGDRISDIENSMQLFIKEGCYIIICAARDVKKSKYKLPIDVVKSVEKSGFVINPPYLKLVKNSDNETDDIVNKIFTEINKFIGK